jgi:hypothetical protein
LAQTGVELEVVLKSALRDDFQLYALLVKAGFSLRYRARPVATMVAKVDCTG